VPSVLNRNTGLQTDEFKRTTTVKKYFSDKQRHVKNIFMTDNVTLKNSFYVEQRYAEKNFLRTRRIDNVKRENFSAR